MSKQSIDSFLESSLGMKFFQRSVCSICIHLTIKALYFRSFVVSVLFAPFHFKIIRKSLSLLGLLEKVFELLVTMTKHVRNLFNNDFVMLWITLFFATPAKLLHLLVPSEYDSRKPFTNTKSSFYAKSDWFYVPRWYLSYPVCVNWKLRMA